MYDDAVNKAMMCFQYDLFLTSNNKSKELHYYLSTLQHETKYWAS